MDLSIYNGNALIKAFLDDFKTKRLKGYERYNNAYEGKHAILQREGQLNGIENHLIINFQKLVVDMAHNYLLAKPINYTSSLTEGDKDYKNAEEFLEKLQEIFSANDEHYHSSEVLKHTSILGDGYEYWYSDKQGNIKVMEFPALECYGIYSNKTRELEAVLRVYEMEEVTVQGNTKKYHNIEFYTDTDITYYTMKDGSIWLDTSIPENPKPHFMGEIPIVHFSNSKEIGSFYGQSELKDIISLIDNYEEVLTSLADTIEYHASPYYILEGAMMDSSQMEEVHASKMFILPEESKISYLTWEQNINAIQYHLDILKKNILEISNTPDLNAEADSNLSGVAIKMKFAGADLKANKKEIEYKRGLKKRLRLIAKLLNLLQNKTYIADNININFNRSIPQNLNEIADTLSKLNGVISKETLISQIPFIQDVTAELEKLEVENQGSIDLEQLYPEKQAGKGVEDEEDLQG